MSRGGTDGPRHPRKMQSPWRRKTEWPPVARLLLFAPSHHFLAVDCQQLPQDPDLIPHGSRYCGGFHVRSVGKFMRNGMNGTHAGTIRM